jgi:ribonuclease P protein component
LFYKPLSIAKAFSLGKKDRLKSRKLIGLLFDQGEVITFQPFRLLFRRTPLTDDGIILQAGFTASTKNFRHATDRNRVKRLMREAWRQNKPVLSEGLRKKNCRLDVFLIYTARELPEWNVLKPKMDLLAAKLLGKINEYPA